MSNQMLAASVTRTGASHHKTGRSNEDSVHFQLLPNGEGIVAAVSDGAGSSSKSKQGSQLAATYAVKRTAEVINAGETDLAHAVQAGILTARLAIRQQAETVAEKDSEANIADYHCTLVLVAWVGNQVAAAQVGDGAATAEHKGVCKMLTVPRRGEYANETYFINESHFREVMFTRETSDITALAMFTDGIQKQAVDFQNRKANAEFIAGAISALREADEVAEIAELPADIEVNGMSYDEDGNAVPAPQAGHRVFQWVKQQVGHTTDDMSLIVATRLDHG